MIYHFVRNKVKEKVVRLKYIFIDQMIIDELIKPLKLSKFLISRSLMGLASSELKEVEGSS